MNIRQHIPRLLTLPAFTAAVLLAQSGIAHADSATTTSSSQSSSAQSAASTGVSNDSVGVMDQKYIATNITSGSPVAATSIKTSCIGSDALDGAPIFTVDGKTVPALRGNAHQGAVVSVAFKIAKDCDNAALGLAAYQAPSDHWDATVANLQKLVGKNSGTFAAGTTNNLKITLPSCNYQVDFFTGAVLDKITAGNNYAAPNNDLIDADNGGTKSCNAPVPPPTTSTTVPAPTTSTTVPAPTPAAVCPTSVSDRITSYSYTINGKSGFETLYNNVLPGDVVMVNFTIAAHCADQQLSLVSYEAPAADFAPETASEQHVFQSQTGTFGPGAHAMTVKVPGCFFQIDFVNGPVIEHLGPVGSNNFYSNHQALIDSGAGGNACQVTTSTTVPVKVLDATVTQPQQLATTGVNLPDLFLFGASLTLLGAALSRASRRLRRV